ncbi:thermonuclease family protein [Mycoplasmopsis felifaucium]|uniref:thermonuclease family protein n=1 Tax=Mycoplasmopsis felifaucium TaxID=35768 RepID=UPI000483CFCA|nr:thermonuclease family protein [Mycoplasmopsis felifaucium]
MNKKLLLGSLVLSASFLPVVSAACVTKQINDGPKIVELDTRINLNVEKVAPYMFKAVVVSGADGDTVTVRALEANEKNGIAEGIQNKIRIAGIDTPEKAVGGKIASKQEQHFSTQSSDFASKTLFNGKEVYVFLTLGGKSDTFGRFTGDIFYSNEKNQLSSIADVNRSYSVEIIKAGLTLPLDQGGQNLPNMVYSNTAAHWTYYLMGLALKYAKDNKIGFFGERPMTTSYNPYEKLAYTAYKIKPIGEGWRSFAFEGAGNPDIQTVYDYAQFAYKPIKVVYANGEVVENGVITTPAQPVQK